MKKTLIVLVAFMVTAVGCRSYTASEVPDTVPRDQSYCQRIGDMAIGIEPYMVKDKTAYVFNSNLWKQKVLALDVSMLVDGDKTYTVKRAEVSATDEFGNEYSPMDAKAAAERIGGMHMQGVIAGRELPDEVKASSNLAQGFLYFDMKPNNAESRRFTVHFFATADDGSGSKEFGITVDPYRMHMNPTERWSSYYGGATPCGPFAKAEESKPMMAPAASNDASKAEEAANRAEEAAKRAEEAAQKQERMYEKQLYK